MYNAKVKNLAKSKKMRGISDESSEVSSDKSSMLSSLNEDGEVGPVLVRKRSVEDDASLSSKISKNTDDRTMLDLTVNPPEELTLPVNEEDNAKWVKRVASSMQGLMVLFSDFKAGQSLVLQVFNGHTLRIGSLPDEDLSKLPGIAELSMRIDPPRSKSMLERLADERNAIDRAVEESEKEISTKEAVHRRMDGTLDIRYHNIPPKAPSNVSK